MIGEMATPHSGSPSTFLEWAGIALLTTAVIHAAGLELGVASRGICRFPTQVEEVSAVIVRLHEEKAYESKSGCSTSIWDSPSQPAADRATGNAESRSSSPYRTKKSDERTL